jgi:hypothetical protein
MTGLRIIDSNNSEIQWSYKGHQGVCTVDYQGTVQGAVLANQDFALRTTVANHITQACQRWLDRQSGSDTSPRRFNVRVQRQNGNSPHYSVLASSEDDACLLAFALDGGFPLTLNRLEQGHLELAKEHCEVVS